MVMDLFVLLLSWLLAAVVAALIGRAGPEEFAPADSRGGQVYSLMSGLLLVTLAMYGQYTRRSPFWDDVRVMWRYVGLFALANFALNFFVQISFTRTVNLLAWILVMVLLPVGRIAAREWMILGDLWRHKALVVGEGEDAGNAIAALQRERHMGIQVVGSTPFMSRERASQAGEVGLFDRTYSESMAQDVESMARQLDCDVIVVVLEDEVRGRAAQLVRTLHAQQFEVFVVPSLEGLPVHGMQPQHFFSNDVLILRLQHKLLSPVSRGLKRSLDCVLASLALLLLSPLMVWVAWRIWREDGGPVVFSHPRVGHDGKEFPFYKFRSMVRDADGILESWQTDNPVLFNRFVASNFKLEDDPRILKIGRLIRRTSLDELPQLWNVLRGDMSLVGPRPLLARELTMYPSETLDLYKQVKPGITGLWQVSGRSHTSFEQRALFDSWYVRNWSLWVDWVVIIKTVRVVLGRDGAY